MTSRELDYKCREEASWIGVRQSDQLCHCCRFPESESPMGFWENLVSGTDMVTENDRRWPVGLHGTPGRFGKLIEYHMFDAPFFSVHGKQASVSF
jgi:fatty acid synthase